MTDNKTAPKTLNQKINHLVGSIEEMGIKPAGISALRMETEKTNQRDTVKLRGVWMMRVNNVAIVENVSVTGGDETANAAKVAFRAGAEEMAKMVSEKVKSGDMAGLVELLAATETKSFYGE